MTTERPFRIAIPDARLTQLRTKLELTTLPDELEDAGWTYGAPRADIERLASRWRDGYDWRKHEAELNAELPQFTRDIEVDEHGILNVHYVHQKSASADALPLLFTHGWPGSFLEVRKILPLLTKASPEQPSFHVVALSLPGFAFSEAPRKKGFASRQYAELGHKLMLALDYNEYVTQAGDWGFYVTRKIASLYGGKHVKAWHTNFPLADPPHPTKTPWLYLQHLLSYTPFNPYTAEERACLARDAHHNKNGRGYFIEQATQPQTLGYSLADSPVGLLAWIYEKLRRWTFKYPWKDDEVLTWVSIFWFSRAGPAASLRIYYEMEHDPDAKPYVPNVPLGISWTPLETVPKSWTRYLGNVVFDSPMHKRGGHFLSYEEPEILASDLRKMFGADGPAYGVAQDFKLRRLRRGPGVKRLTSKL